MAILYDMVDVSKWQGAFNWQAAINKGVKHAMIRAGYGSYASQKDPQFERNVAECERLNIDWGAYWYSYATSVAQAKQEAATFIQVIGDRKPTMPLAFDIEYEPGILALSNATRTAIVKAFLDTLEDAGYYAILYASQDFIKSRLNWQQLSAYDVWCAQYGSKCTCPLPYGIWQYSSKNALGIPGYGSSLDSNHVYKDYPSIVKSAGLNNWQGVNPIPDTPQLDDDPDDSNKQQVLTIGPISPGDIVAIYKLCESLGLVDMGLYKADDGVLTIGPVSSGDAYMIMRKCMELQLTDMGLYKSKYV